MDRSRCYCRKLCPFQMSPRRTRAGTSPQRATVICLLRFALQNSPPPSESCSSSIPQSSQVILTFNVVVLQRPFRQFRSTTSLSQYTDFHGLVILACTLLPPRAVPERVLFAWTRGSGESSRSVSSLSLSFPLPFPLSFPAATAVGPEPEVLRVRFRDPSSSVSAFRLRSFVLAPGPHTPSACKCAG